MEDFKDLKLDVKDIKSDIGDIKVTLAKNTESLIFHIERTALNERRIEMVEKWLLGLMGSLVVALIVRSFLK